MNPFMKPLYQEFEENLYRLFSLTLDEFRKFEADQGDWEHTLEASESKPSKYEERFMIDADITGGGWVKLVRVTA